MARPIKVVVLFRNSKSDRDSEGRTPVEDGTSLSAALDGRAGAVASSALRWLGRSRRPDDAVDGVEDDDDDLELTNLIGKGESKVGARDGRDDDRAGHEERASDPVPADDLDGHDRIAEVEVLEDEDEEVELSMADEIAADDDDVIERSPTDDVDVQPVETVTPETEVREETIARETPVSSPEAVSQARIGQAPASQGSASMAAGAEFFDYDDDDDLGDFDDLGAIANAIPPSAFIVESPPEAPVLDSPSSDDHVEPAPHEVPPAEAIAEAPSELGEEDRIDATFDPAEPDQPGQDIAAAVSPQAHEPAQQDDAEPTHIEQDYAEAEAAPAPSVNEAGRSQGKRSELEEAAAPAPLDTSLALQPIPELQSGARSRSEPASSSSEPAAGEPTAGEPAADDMEMSDEDGDGIDASSPDLEASDLDDLDLDQLDTTLAEQIEERVDDDWHAHLAEVLCEDGKQPKEDPAEATQEQANDDEHRPAVLALSKPAIPKPILPKTVATEPVAKLAATNRTDDDDDDVPVPPILTKTPRPQPRPGDSGSTVSGETEDLSQEQLSIGIIANVQRLRRFAAVQVGDEMVADQLVQTTVESALANGPPLSSDRDLGLALMMLLYRQRREMAIDPDAPQASVEAIRAFETTLCHGLSGADQFEIRAFAEAMNELDEQDRELLVLIALENLSYEQIGEIIRIPTQQVMNRLANARLSLRQALATHNPGLSERASRADTPHGREIEIHGYLDGELDGHHMADVDALVEYDEDAADRLLHYGIQGDLIRRLYAPLINRPIPHRMLAALAIAAKPARRGFRFGARRALIAGGVLALLVGSAAAWTYLAPSLNGVVPDAMAVSTVAADVSH